jgi:mRNA interferase MazF
VALNKGEANLPRKCVVNVTQIKSVDRRRIREKIGTLPKRRLEEVESGLKLILGMT